jgi:aspartyl protease family protein
MATGFMPNIIALLLWFACGAAVAADVALIGVIGDKAAVLAVDGGDPKTVKVGQKWNGISVLSVEKDRAIVEIDGKQRVLARGAHYRSAAALSTRETTILTSDGQGHFFTDGAVNGMQLRFLVDTGATFVVLSGEEARRMGIDYRNAPRGRVQTAAGVVSSYVTKFDRVRIGSIELSNVDAVVVEQNIGTALLGMSFLNRVEMRRDGESMTLIRRF